jgi:hypothetical protein
MIYRCIKVQHKPIKKIEDRVQIQRSKETTCALVWRTRLTEEQCATVRGSAEPPVRGAPDSEQCMSGATPDCLVPLEDKASNG